jgi:hypothetical protein
MSNIIYGLIEETCFLDNTVRITYGVAAYANSREDGTATVVAAVCDICSDRSRLEEFIDSCNRLELSLIHLNDVIDDFLADEN